jgi:hypothetical protein
MFGFGFTTLARGASFAVRGFTRGLSAAASPVRAGSASTQPAATVHLERLRAHGLLSGGADDFHWARALTDPAASGALLTTPGLLWAAVEHDVSAVGLTPAAYLQGVVAKKAQFVTPPPGTPKAVVNHSATLEALGALGTADGLGKLLLLTGPTSVGKSTLLKKVARDLAASGTRRVLLADARQHGSDLSLGLVTAIAADRSFLEQFKEAVRVKIGHLPGPLTPSRRATRSPSSASSRRRRRARPSPATPATSCCRWCWAAFSLRARPLASTPSLSSTRPTGRSVWRQATRTRPHA